MLFILQLLGMYGLLVFSGGFIALYFAKKQNSLLLKIAGWVLTLGGVVVLALTAYWGHASWRGDHFRSSFCIESSAQHDPSTPSTLQSNP